MAGCAGPLSTLDPAGPSAASIANLWWVMLAGATVLMAFVLGLFALAFLRPDWHWRESAGKSWMLWGGLIMPILVLTALMIFALLNGERLLTHQAPDVVRVEAHAERWQWRFRYPDNPDMTETIDTLYIPADTPVDVEITSADVIHSFWVPRLAGKLDAIPGHRNRLRIRADRPGLYGGVCSEYCGVGHAGMHFTVEALPVAEFGAAIVEDAR